MLTPAPATPLLGMDLSSVQPAKQKPLPRCWAPEDEETHPHICELPRTSTTLWINQKRLPQLPAELGELWRTATNGEGESRFQTLTHFSERLRTIFPKSSANTPPHTPPQDCGRPRTLANDPELGHLDAIWSSIHLMTSCSFQTTVREPNWICFEKVPSFMRA